MTVVFTEKYLREGSTGGAWCAYQYWCPHSVGDLLRPGYWGASRGLLQPGDHIECICAPPDGKGPQGYVTAVVASITNRHSKVSEPSFVWKKKAISSGVNPDSPILSVEVVILFSMRLRPDVELDEDGRPLVSQEMVDGLTEAEQVAVGGRGADGRFARRSA